jgi:spore maturation protein CgeB
MDEKHPSMNENKQEAKLKKVKKKHTCAHKVKTSKGGMNG